MEKTNERITLVCQRCGKWLLTFWKRNDGTFFKLDADKKTMLPVAVEVSYIKNAQMFFQTGEQDFKATEIVKISCNKDNATHLRLYRGNWCK